MTNDPTTRTASLAEATVQQIQFELFRRSAVSVEYGDRVEPLIDVLRAHPDQWQGMVIDRIHIGHRGHGLLPMTMIPLPDIGQHFWNVDALYLLCPSRGPAEQGDTPPVVGRPPAPAVPAESQDCQHEDTKTAEHTG